MSVRKFYKTVISYEVLSENPIPSGMSLDDIYNECVEGAYSGQTLGINQTTLNAKQAVEALQNQGSDPEFFGLNEDGENIYE